MVATAQFAPALLTNSEICDFCSAILCRGDRSSDIRVLRYPLDITEIFINVGNPDSRADTFDTDMIEALNACNEAGGSGVHPLERNLNAHLRSCEQHISIHPRSDMIRPARYPVRQPRSRPQGLVAPAFSVRTSLGRRRGIALATASRSFSR